MKRTAFSTLLLAASIATAQTTNTMTTNTSAAPAIAAGTSTTTANDAKPAARPYSLTLIDEMETSQAQLDQGAAQNAKVTHAVAATLKYTFNPKFNVSLAQNASTTTQSGVDNNFYVHHTVVKVGTSFDGFLGSDKVSPSLSYYLPTNAAKADFERAYNADIDGYYGILRGDMMITWTLTPLVNVAYYMNPRQTFMKEQTVLNKENGSAVELYDTTRYNQIFSVNLTPNDIVNPYVYIQHDFRAATDTLTGKKEDAIAGIGTSIALGNFSLNPEIYSQNTYKANGKNKSVRYLSHETVNYYLAASYKF